MGWCKKSLGWWVLSGGLLGVGFLVPSLWVFGIVGGALFIKQSFQEETFLSLLGGGWIAWSIKYIFASSPILSTYPLDILGVKLSIGTQYVLIGLYWIITSLALGLGVLLVIVALWWYRKFFNSLPRYWMMIVLLPAWVLSELCGSVLFSILLLGSGGMVTSVYSFGYSGYLLGEHELLVQLARFAGVYGLSAVFVFGTAGVYLLAKRPRIVLVLLLVLYVSGYLYHPAQPSGGDDFYTVRTIDTNPDRTLFQTAEGAAAVREALATAVAAAMEDNPDYLILPEAAGFFQNEQSIGTEVLRFQKNYPASHTIIVDSGVVQHHNRLVFEARVVDTLLGESVSVHKRYLVPQGEYMPIVYTAAISAFGSRSFVQYFNERINLEIGSLGNQGSLSDESPGILFCFDSVSPVGVRTILEEKSTLPFIAHPVSHQWFHESRVLWHELDVMLRMQALWNGVYIVSAGNYMSGKTYAPNGAIIQMDTIAIGDGWQVKQVSIPR